MIKQLYSIARVTFKLLIISPLSDVLGLPTEMLTLQIFTPKKKNREPGTEMLNNRSEIQGLLLPTIHRDFRISDMN